MKCLDWKEKISGYIDGEISSEEARQVEAHLETCGECRTLERRMRAIGTGVARVETDVPPDFREKLFTRLEAEELLPRRRSLFVFSLRWAAVPLAVAASVAVFLFVSPEKGKDAGAPQPTATSSKVSPQAESQPSNAAPGKGQPVATAAAGLSVEEREIVANLEVLEDPAAIDEQGDPDTIEIFEPSVRRQG
ncbi:MAG: zf-HC2 domain-containing protein [Deltaproteobacteria bacterium]|nr:zf-HC2 domain-containing protein [Deltaproteobacteria bacterium]